MKVLIVGSGGREHALTWKTAQSNEVEQVYVAPGNAGTAAEPKTRNVPIASDDVEALLRFSNENAIDMTIVGPEAPLVRGIVDQFRAAGRKCFGPTQAAARLEGSKAFAKDFLARYGIPTAIYRSFTRADFERSYIETHPLPIVVKADGLAAGKGVIIAQTAKEALDAIEGMFEGRFGTAGDMVVVEEYLTGEEASFTVMVDGESILPLATSQDHKARDDGDRGPNTGGMGAYSPAPVVDDTLHLRIIEQVIEPTVRGMSAEGTPFSGFLYAGLMISDDGQPRVLEFNCRFGDPETQPILLRLRSDLVSLCDAAITGALHSAEVSWDPRPALGVVMAAGGYPGSYAKGEVISGLTEADRDYGKVFHAGTAERNAEIVTNGGRVLCATALGETVAQAQQRAYEIAGCIQWKDVYYRRDIGYRAVAREKAAARHL